MAFDLVSSMSKSEWDDFDGATVIGQLGEVGCRNIQRMYVVEATPDSAFDEDEITPLIINDWVDVQDGIYRYHTLQLSGGIQVKIILSEYMACTVFWEY